MQYQVQWTEKNKDGSESLETIKMKAKDSDNAVEQVKAIANPVEIKSITRLV